MLKLALDTRLPMIHLTTDDLLYPREVLQHIAGTEVQAWAPNAEGTFPKQDVLFTSADCATPQLYFQLEAAGKSLVFLNVKQSALHFVAGPLLPPKELVKKVLASALEDQQKAGEVLPAFGGLTLKDVHEVLHLTQEWFPEVTTAAVNKIRQGYVGRMKGMVQVETSQDFYQVPYYLQGWLNDNLPFLQKPTHPRLTPRGLLFDGPPGTGKSAAAKCIANALGRPLFRIDIGAMKGKYVGDSEGNLLAALKQVDQMEPCVVLLDECEKMFGEQSDSGVTSSMLSTLLWWMQEHRSQVFTLMTTNKKSAIPPELYREGRIDAVMDFKGLESYEEASVFVSALVEKVTAATGCPSASQLVTTMVMAQVKALQVSGPVPQSKVEQLVNSKVKKIILEGV